MVKKYEAPGMMEWHPVITVGRSRMTVSFEGGHFSGRGQTPATFETADPVVQALIENSSHFKAGRIRMAPGYRPGIAMKKTGTGAGFCREPDRKAEEMQVKEFQTFDEARDYLTMEKKISRTKTMTEESCIKEAAKMGIELRIKS